MLMAEHMTAKRNKTTGTLWLNPRSSFMQYTALYLAVVLAVGCSGGGGGGGSRSAVAPTPKSQSTIPTAPQIVPIDTTTSSSTPSTTNVPYASNTTTPLGNAYRQGTTIGGGTTAGAGGAGGPAGNAAYPPINDPTNPATATIPSNSPGSSDGAGNRGGTNWGAIAAVAAVGGGLIFLIAKMRNGNSAFKGGGGKFGKPNTSEMQEALGRVAKEPPLPVPPPAAKPTVPPVSDQPPKDQPPTEPATEPVPGEDPTKQGPVAAPKPDDKSDEVLYKKSIDPATGAETFTPVAGTPGSTTPPSNTCDTDSTAAGQLADASKIVDPGTPAADKRPPRVGVAEAEKLRADGTLHQYLTEKRGWSPQKAKYYEDHLKFTNSKGTKQSPNAWDRDPSNRYRADKVAGKLRYDKDGNKIPAGQRGQQPAAKPDKPQSTPDTKVSNNSTTNGDNSGAGSGSGKGGGTTGKGGGSTGGDSAATTGGTGKGGTTGGSNGTSSGSGSTPATKPVTPAFTKADAADKAMAELPKAHPNLVKDRGDYLYRAKGNGSELDTWGPRYVSGKYPGQTTGWTPEQRQKYFEYAKNWDPKKHKALNPMEPADWAKNALVKKNIFGGGANP